MKNINKNMSSVAPCPAEIDKYFKHSLKYTRWTQDSDPRVDPFHVTYTRAISHVDGPMFKELFKKYNCQSIIDVDVFNGKLKDNNFVIKKYLEDNKSEKVYIYEYADLCKVADLAEYSYLEKVYEYHCNIVHLTKEFLAGGWLYLPKYIEKLQFNRGKKITYLTPKTTNLNKVLKAVESKKITKKI